MSNLKYGRCLIKTAQTNGAWRARALHGTLVASPILIADTEDGAVLAVKSHLDAIAAAERSMRASDGYPTIGLVQRALGVIRKTKAQVDMLSAHCAAPDHVMTATQIAVAGGYKTYSSANSQYGALARLLAEEMEYEPPKRTDGTTMWTYALAVDANDSMLTDDDGHFRWRMRPEVVQALG